MAKRKKPIQLQPGQSIEVDSTVSIEGHPSSRMVRYDPVTDTVSHVQQTDSDGRVIADEKFDPPLKASEPLAREFEARPCSSCQALRPHGKNYSRVYCTRGNIRYCKCHFCNHTWAQEGK